MKPLVDIDSQIASMQADESLGLHDLPRITSQQRVYIAARVSGLSMRAASKEAGCGTVTAQNWERDEVMKAYRDHYEAEFEQNLTKVNFGLEDAHGMYMKAFHMSATAMEMVRATDSLVKLHRVNEAPVPELPKNVTTRQLADLPLSELMRLASINVDSLQPGAIEGEYAEVDDEVPHE